MERDGLATTVSRLSTPTFRTTRQPRPHWPALGPSFRAKPPQVRIPIRHLWWT